MFIYSQPKSELERHRVKARGKRMSIQQNWIAAFHTGTVAESKLLKASAMLQVVCFGWELPKHCRIPRVIEGVKSGLWQVHDSSAMKYFGCI